MYNKKSIIGMIIFSLLFSFMVPMSSYAKTNVNKSANHAPPHIRAGGWVIMDAQTGEIYGENNPNGRFYPASITKILTTIIALKKLNLNQMISISANANKFEGTQLALPTGTQLSVQDALYAMMLQSANDATVAIAEAVSGSEANFAQLMNSFAASIGATHSHFVTANGLHNKDHYTTAHDMAVITRYAMQNPEFQKIAATKNYPWKQELFSKRLKRQMPLYAQEAGIPYDGTPELINHNDFVFRYPYSIGIKNGFTDQASFTLVGGAKRGDLELIGVFMKAQSKDTAYPDMAALMDYTFPIAQKQHQELDRQNKKEETSKPLINPKPSPVVTLEKSVKGTLYLRHRTLIFFSSVLGVCLLLALYLIGRRAKKRRKRKRMERLQNAQRRRKTVNW